MVRITTGGIPGEYHAPDCGCAGCDQHYRPAPASPWLTATVCAIFGVLVFGPPLLWLCR